MAAQAPPHRHGRRDRARGGVPDRRLTLGDTLSANFNQLFSTATSGISVVVRSATTLSGGVTGTRPPIPASLVHTVLLPQLAKLYRDTI